jgi:NADH-quinone oxidoreductase subunit J
VADPAFLSAAGLFVLLGAEFVAMLLIIVYVGAVAVLFLFVVMMLDVDFAELKAEMAKYMPLAVLIGVVLLMQLALASAPGRFRTGSTRGWATRRHLWMRRTTPRRSA